ncbi:hypothetical protein D9613_005270 [Agrocybe pediades]|uniref:F-box domain-containing protein n=1 Tax=Agrocybe pediades TaxID=84607 RepID=A0A8H4VT91_9AGAR|nr:hypothetical protein D9613_005270 [Agrocybe pediades]
MSNVSKRFYAVASDPSLNPWRKPITRILSTHAYTASLKHLSVRSTVPRQNWIDILSLARPSFILFEATLPNLSSRDWEECFKRRFLPSWDKWRKDLSWREAYIRLLHRVWHRASTTCTTDESWTKYIVLNRKGSANELGATSRNFDPSVIFNQIKLQSNLSHLETRTTVVLQLADVRILAYGILARPRSDFLVNPNAHILLNPPGITGDKMGHLWSERIAPARSEPSINDYGVYPMASTSLYREYHHPSTNYSRLLYPQPSFSHRAYPYHTPGGHDMRWASSQEIVEGDMRWVGNMMLTAQLLGPTSLGSAASRYASFSWQDLWAIAPWMQEVITSRIDGLGLGN